MKRAGALLLTLFLCAPCAFAEEAGKDGPAPPALVERERVRDILARLYGNDGSPPPFSKESTHYAIRGGLFGIFSGSAAAETRLEEQGGREVYRLSLVASVAGRRQEEEALFDARGIFPLRYTRKVRVKKGRSSVDTILWDHLGGRLYCQSDALRGGVAIRENWRREFLLGEEIPAETMDPLTALYRYRRMTVKEGVPVPWEVTLMESCDGISRCRFLPLPGGPFERETAAGKARVFAVKQECTGEGEGEKSIDLEIAVDRAAAITRFSGALFGVGGVYKIESRTAVGGSQ